RECVPALIHPSGVERALKTAYVCATMAKEERTRRQYLTLMAIEPGDGTLTCEILVSFDRMQAVAKRSMGHTKECGLILPQILQTPSAIFEGLRRDEDEDRSGVG